MLGLLAGAVTALAATDPEICLDDSGDVAIEACNRVINSGRYSTEEVATAYINRGLALARALGSRGCLAPQRGQNITLPASGWPHE